MGSHYTAICNLIFFPHLTYPRHICVSIDKNIPNCFNVGHRTSLYGCIIISLTSPLRAPFLQLSVSLYYKAIMIVFLCISLCKLYEVICIIDSQKWKSWASFTFYISFFFNNLHLHQWYMRILNYSPKLLSEFEISASGVPAVAQRDRWHLGSAGTQV